MSLQLMQEDILFFQRFLKGQNFYTAGLDGIWGNYTERASREFEQASLHLREELGEFDVRSEGNIFTLALTLQRECRLFLARVASLRDIKVKVISGTRTYAQQAYIYEQGRGRPGNIVTHAKPGESNHNFGIAWDIAVFDDAGNYLTDNTPYERVAAAGLSAQLEWGGRWTRFPDLPHYELSTVLSLAQIRDRFEQGKSLTQVT